MSLQELFQKAAMDKNLREVMSWIRAEILPPNASEEELLFSKVAEAALQAAEAASLGGEMEATAEEADSLKARVVTNPVEIPAKKRLRW